MNSLLASKPSCRSTSPNKGCPCRGSFPSTYRKPPARQTPAPRSPRAAPPQLRRSRAGLDPLQPLHPTETPAAPGAPASAPPDANRRGAARLLSLQPPSGSCHELWGSPSPVGSPQGCPLSPAPSGTPQPPAE